MLKIIISIESIRQALADGGAEFWLPPTEVGVPERLVVTVQDERHVFAIKRQGRAPYPNELPRFESFGEALAEFGIPLLITEHITRQTGEKLTGLGWSWADNDGNIDIRARGLLVKQRKLARKKRRSSPTLPLGPSSLRLIRWLASRPASTWRTSEMASRSGASVSTVSQVMRRLGSQDLAERVARGDWYVRSAPLLEQFLRDYEGPGGESRYFFFAGPVAQATRVLVEAPEGPNFAISGDVGADQLAPWRAPTHSIIYARRWFEVPSLPGLVRADSQHSANITLVVPSDETLFLTEETLAARPLPLAHPTQIMWDLIRLGGEDRIEALEPVREKMGLRA